MSDDVVAQAASLMEVGRFDDALRVLDREPRPGRVDWLALRAHCLLALERYDDTMAAVAAWLAAAPDDTGAHRVASTALARLDRTVESVRAAETAVRLGPMDWRNHVSLALATATPISANRCGAAAADALRLAPHEPDALFALGLAHELDGDKQRAAHFYQRALAIDPLHVDAELRLAAVADGRSAPYRRAAVASHALGADPTSRHLGRHVDRVLARFAGHAAGSVVVAGAVGWLLSRIATAPPALGVVLVVAGLALGAVRARRLVGDLAPGVRTDLRFRVARQRSWQGIGLCTTVAATCLVGAAAVPGKAGGWLFAAVAAVGVGAYLLWDVADPS